MVKGADGKTLASIGAPLAWDAVVDSERTHPVTQSWESESTLPGVARSIGRVPLAPPAGESIGPAPGTTMDTVDRTPAAPKASAADRATAKEKPGRATNGEAKAAHASPPITLPRALVGSVPKNNARFDLTLDDAFLQDPDTVFPVVIDPTPVVVKPCETTGQDFFVGACLGSVVVMVALGWLIQAPAGGLAATGGRVNRRGLAA